VRPGTLTLVSAHRFYDSPIGHFVRGQDWVVFAADESLKGCVLWGNPAVRDMALLIRCIAALHTPAAPPHVGVCDARAMTNVDVSAFPAMKDYIKKHASLLEAKVERFAVVRPSGFLGTVAAGFFRVVRAPYPVRIFRHPARALSWLGRPDGLSLLRDLQPHRESSSTNLLDRLAATLGANLVEAELDVAARRLGVSARTLQRRLHAEGTTFQDELRAARVRAARSLMRGTEASLTEIAMEAGFASAAHLSVEFRKAVGESPSAWRARTRA
jgi:AraC-like DNA-binding protein